MLGECWGEYYWVPFLYEMDRNRINISKSCEYPDQTSDIHIPIVDVLGGFSVDNSQHSLSPTMVQNSGYQDWFPRLLTVLDSDIKYQSSVNHVPVIDVLGRFSADNSHHPLSPIMVQNGGCLD